MSASNQKKAIVLGGSHGLGKAISEMLVRSGIETVIAGKSREMVDETVKELSAFGDISGKQLDLTHDYDVDLFIEELDGYLSGEIDYLINAAGFFCPKDFLETTISDYDALLDLNRGFFFITQEIVKKMRITGGGVILNISSFLSQHAMKGIPAVAFSMAKAGLEAFTRQLSVELAPYKVRVNAVSLGILENGSLDSNMENVPPSWLQEMHKSFDGLHSVGHSGKLSEITQIVDLLISDKGAYVNGAVWDVDGGLSAGRM